MANPSCHGCTGLLLYFKSVRVAKNILYCLRRGFQLCLFNFVLGKQQLPVMQLQCLVKGQHPANLQGFLFGGLVVNKPDQVVLGKSFRHRHIGF